MTLGSHNIEFTYTGETWVPKLPNQTVTTPAATSANNVWQWYDNGTEMIPYRNQDELQRILAGNSTPKPAAPTSTVTRAAVELSDEALYTGMHVADDGVGAALRGAGHNADDVANVVAQTADKADDVAKGITQVADKADDAAKGIAQVADKTDDVAKGFNWAKAGKIGAIVLGAAAIIGGAAWLINKACKKDETPVDETPVEDTPAKTEPETPVAPNEPEVPVVPVAPTEPEVPVAPTEPTEPEAPATPELKTEYEAQRGDGIWHIAERYLKDKYANEPDKFENLTTEEKNKMILDETLRIAELNNYELVERTINGKKQIVPNPTLHPGDKVKVQ